MIAIVSGGTGYIGACLVRKLISLSYRVFIVNRSGNATRFNHFHESVSVVKYDGTYTSLERKLPKENCVIFHVAADSNISPKPSEINQLVNSNITLGLHLLEWVKKTDQKYFINTSSFSMYKDNRRYSPQNLYAATKQAFKDIMLHYVQNCGVSVVDLVLYDVYGPNDHRNKFIDLVLTAIRDHKELDMSPGDQEVAYVYIDDVVEAFIMAYETAKSCSDPVIPSYSVLGTEVMTLNALVSYIQKTLNVSIKTNVGKLSYRKNEIMTVNPVCPCLPGWSAKVKLCDGIKELWKRYC